MATKLEKLMFRIGVKDDASGPVGKLQKALRSTSRMSKQAWGQLAGGAMTAAGAGLALEGMVSPALDLNRALPTCRLWMWTQRGSSCWTPRPSSML